MPAINVHNSDIPPIDLKPIDRTQFKSVIKADKQQFSQVTKRLQVYRALPNKFRPILEDIAEYVRDEIITDVFEKEGPDWKPLAARTRKERILQGFPGSHPILYRTGDLFKELTDKTHPNHIQIIKVGTNARVEIGGSSRKFIENQGGVPQSRLPARPMVATGVSNRDRIAMREIVRKGIERALRR